MAGLWSVKPFVSLAGEDGNGFRQEVLVQKGCGTVSNIDDKGHTVNVELTEPKLQYPLHGWINKTERNSDELTAAYKVVKAHYESGEPMDFRIEQQRLRKNKRTKQPIDPKTPIYELLGADENGNNKSTEAARDNTVKLLVGVGDPDGKMEFIQALTNPAEDPSSQGDRPTSALGRPVAARSQSAPVDMSQVERQPWVDRNPDGNVNPGCYGVETEMDFVFWITKYIHEHDVELGERNINTLAKLLMSLADKLQHRIYKGRMKDTNRNIGSYTRARWIIKNVIENYEPITAEAMESKSSLKEWKDQVGKRSLAIWSNALDYYTKLVDANDGKEEKPKPTNDDEGNDEGPDF